MSTLLRNKFRAPEKDEHAHCSMVKQFDELKTVYRERINKIRMKNMITIELLDH